MPASLSTSYCGPAPIPEDLWGRWNFDPWLIAVMMIAAVLFALRPATSRERLYFSTAMAFLVVAFISPLCALTVALFSARVVHHVLLVALAAPLLALALGGRRWVLGPLLMPLVMLHTVVFWLWHSPDAYVMALSNTPVYWLMQITLLGTAMAMWAAIFRASPARAITALLFLTIQMGLLGALLVFAGAPLYTPHFATTLAFGLEPQSDQQLAGLIMWVPASLPYIGVGLARLLMMLRAPWEQRA